MEGHGHCPLLTRPAAEMARAKTARGEMARFVCDAPLTVDAFRAEAARRGATVRRYRKIAPVAARPASDGERVSTRWRGLETTNTGRSGDYRVVTLAPDQSVMRDPEGALNAYLVPADRFDALYERIPGETAEGPLYRPKGAVEAFFLPGGFDILAPWGERQRAARGYLLRNGDDVYGNHADTFEAAYRALDAEPGDAPGPAS